MSLQERGWPPGLQPLNMRIGLVRNLDCYGLLSFNTLITGSPISFSFTSSDLDTESTGSFFHFRSITLGSLTGIRSIIEPSRSIRNRKLSIFGSKKSNKRKSWFSLCPRTHVNSEIPDSAPSLGHFPEMERRAINAHGRNQGPGTCKLDRLPRSQATRQNSFHKRSHCLTST